MRARLAVPVLVFDAVALGVWWYLIPHVNRPGDGLCVMLIALGVLTAATVKNRAALSICLTAIAMGVSLYALELAQRRFDLVSLFSRLRQPAQSVSAGGGETSPYQFSARDSESYLRARENALRDGAPPEEIGARQAGDIFAGVPAEELRVHKEEWSARTQYTVVRGESPYRTDSPLGIELRPDCRWRTYAVTKEDGVVLWDSANTTNRFGTRLTPGDDDGEEVYVFMGCSNTYGVYLNDDETLPARFSELYGFGKRVINTAVSGNGPHHALRDLELNLRLGRSGVQPSGVKAVYYGYLPDHARRAATGEPKGSPRYALENGRAVYRGQFTNDGVLGRLGLLLAKTRLYPAIKNRLGEGVGLADEDLALALLAGMHAICRERYDVPLQVIDWGSADRFAERMRGEGIVVHRVADIFGPDWGRWQVKYCMADGHPSAYANRVIARHLHAAAQRALARQATMITDFGGNEDQRGQTLR